ncbi:MAG: 3-hydroxyacyl-CoA dehydrogenase family protein [Candidatus Asgardarchaeia archaeon]
MSMYKIRNIAILGAGTMGSGIAQIAAAAGFTVYLRDISKSFLNRGLARIKRSVEKILQKGLIRISKEEILEKIIPVVSIKQIPQDDIDFVIEAIPENFELKSKTFQEIDQYFSLEVPFATNTSTIRITKLASVTQRPDKFIGVHFFNPPPLMPLVEIIPGELTSNHVLELSKDFVMSLGKEPVILKRDVPGFVVNRILAAALEEAYKLLNENVASKEDIDKAVKLGLKWPMGPFELSDFIGLDVVLSILETLKSEVDERFTPPDILIERVKKGLLGRKSGVGFYNYQK